MRILVSVKRVIDPYVRVVVKADNTGVESNKMTINPFDEIALEAALQMKEASLATEVVVVSIGDDSVKETLRYALAMGADRAIHIVTQASMDDSHQLAIWLSRVVAQQVPELVLMGKQAIDQDNNQTPQMLAALLDWPCHLFASSITYEAGRLHVAREIDGGLETSASGLPAVISVDLRLNQPRYPSLPNIMKAKTKPLETLTVASLGDDVASQTKVKQWVKAPSKQGGELVHDVDALIAAITASMNQ